MSSEWSDQRSRLDALGSETNQVSSQLADLNRGLRAANLNGSDANALLDQRDQLTQRLAELTGARTTVNADSTVEVTLGGQPLVSGNTSYDLTVTGAATLDGASADPVVLSVSGDRRHADLRGARRDPAAGRVRPARLPGSSSTRSSRRWPTPSTPSTRRGWTSGVRAAAPSSPAPPPPPSRSPSPTRARWPPPTPARAASTTATPAPWASWTWARTPTATWSPASRPWCPAPTRPRPARLPW